MKVNSVKNYDAGYSKKDLLKKCAAAAVSAVICTGLTACNSVVGETEVQYDGDMGVNPDIISCSDNNECLTSNPSSGKRSGQSDSYYQLEGDVAVISPSFED